MIENDRCPSGAVRGQEKRRRLFEYLRRHPEELRPGLRTRGNRNVTAP